MTMICEWIESAKVTAGTTFRLLSTEEVDRIVKMIADRLTDPARSNLPLWERFHGEIARKRSDGWSLICDYPESSPIMLFEEEGEFRGCEFASREDMRSILAETPGFEFYVTNRKAEFVLCYNHHDFIIGVGESRDWLSAIEDE